MRGGVSTYPSSSWDGGKPRPGEFPRLTNESMELTSGVIQAMYDQQPVNNPLVQVLEVKRIAAQSQERYRYGTLVPVSNGAYSPFA